MGELTSRLSLESCGGLFMELRRRGYGLTDLPSKRMRGRILMTKFELLEKDLTSLPAGLNEALLARANSPEMAMAPIHIDILCSLHEAIQIRDSHTVERKKGQKQLKQKIARLEALRKLVEESVYKLSEKVYQFSELSGSP